METSLSVPEKMSKISSLDQLKDIVKTSKEQGKKVGYVEGIFDIPHLGHVELVQFAKSNCDLLIVGVASDEYARAAKGPSRPYFPQEQRSRMLAEYQSVDYVLTLDNPPAKVGSNEGDEYLSRITEELNPDVIIASGTTDTNPSAKGARAQKIGAVFVEQKDQRPSPSSSGTKIAEYLGQEA